MLKLGVLVSGGGTNLQAIIDNINSGYLNAKIVSVVSNKKDAYALTRAKNNGIETTYISKKDYSDIKDYNLALVEHFKAKEVDLIILAGFMVILTEEFVNAFKNKIINIHPSLIPSFCGKGFYGLHVHEAVLEKGVKLTGATVHFVDGGADTGPIILQRAIEIDDDDTPETLQKKVMENIEWKILPEAIKLISEDKLEIIDNKVRRKK